MTPDRRPMSESSLALCLSGGGYRASIFHLGALRWLNECGLLPRVTTVSAVSGGSIVAALLATNLRPWPTEMVAADEWEAKVIGPFRRLTQRDIRTPPLLARLLPWNLFRSSRPAELLADQYRRHLLPSNPSLADLPGHPRFVFCATDMVFGVNWESSAERVGNYQAGYCQPPPRHWTVAKAVAASSCFPPLFSPLKIRLRAEDFNRRGDYRSSDRESKLEAIRLTDGGVYDNLGLEPVMRHAAILVSDGGGRLSFEKMTFPWQRLQRYPALLQDGIGKLRKRWLMSDFNRGSGDPSRKAGAYWSIGNSPRSYWEDAPSPTSSADITRLVTRIKNVRTDLNRFTGAEFEILENHGYRCAAERILDKTAELLGDSTPVQQAPSREWRDPIAAARALRSSHRRFVINRR